MQKFFVLLKKEIKELITVRLVIPLLVMTLVFGMIGQMMNDQAESVKSPLQVGVVDSDKSRISEDLIKSIEENNYVVNELTSDDYVEEAKSKDLMTVMVIPENFSIDLEELKKPEIKFYTLVNGFSLADTIKGSKLAGLKAFISGSLSDYLIERKIGNVEPGSLKNPINPVEFVVVKDRTAETSFAMLSGFIQSQTTFVPVILFMIIIIASQMVATTVATEKESKTLEILLSSPINRKMIVFTKILASGLVALLFCLVYILGFKSYMSGMMASVGGGLAQSSQMSEVLSSLGVSIDWVGYFLLGMSLFLSILCALAIAIILGILAEDVKGVQSVITPLMVMILIPYLITMFLDVNTLAPVFKYLFYAIPFSHPFLAMKNVVMQEYGFVIFGIVYQFLVFLVFVFFAAKIFTSDKILTFRLKFKK